MNIQKNFKVITLITFLSSHWVFAEKADADYKYAIFASPVAAAIGTAILEFPIISLAYEHSLGNYGLAFFLPVHAGYREDTDRKQYAFGMGLGFRKYIGAKFSGSYLSVQSDYLVGMDNDIHRNRTQFNPNTLQYDPIPDSVINQDLFLSITQLAYGYKWMWKYVTLDLNIGGAFYADHETKGTNIIGGVNIGIPFSENTFGF